MSTRTQLKGDSLSRQLEASENYARKHGLILDTSLRDLGVSAFEGKNVKEGALGRFLALVEAGEVKRGSYLLLESLDRLSRNKVRLALPLFLSIINAGIRVVTLADNERLYDEDTLDADHFSLMGSLVVMSRANEESATKRDRIRKAYAKARTEARESGKPVWGNYPAWISRAGDGSLVLSEFAESVKTIYGLAEQGMGAVQICKHLNASPEVIPPRRARNGWYASYISRLLRSRAVIGEYQPCRFVDGRSVPDGAPIPAYFPPAVEPDTWTRVQAIVGKRRAAPGPKGVIPNLFTGQCRCGSCGGTMTLRRLGRGDKYLYCLSAMRNRGCNVTGGYRYDWLEEAVLDSVPEWRTSDLLTITNDDDPGVKLGREIAAQQIEVERLETEANNLVTAIAAKGLTRLVDRLEVVERALADARTSIARLEAEKLALGDGRQRQEMANNAVALVEEMRRATGRERILIRTKLAQAVGQFLTQIEFEFASKTFTVIVLNGLAAYRFHRVAVGKDRRAARFGLKDSVSVLDQVRQGHIPAEAFTRHVWHDGRAIMTEGSEDRLARVRSAAGTNSPP